jgi:hypothetical protein
MVMVKKQFPKKSKQGSLFQAQRPSFTDIRHRFDLHISSLQDVHLPGVGLPTLDHCSFQQPRLRARETWELGEKSSPCEQCEVIVRPFTFLWAHALWGCIMHDGSTIFGEDTGKTGIYSQKLFAGLG